MHIPSIRAEKDEILTKGKVGARIVNCDHARVGAA